MNGQFDPKVFVDLLYLIVIPIQLNTFLQTLYKKELISSNVHENTYGASLAVLYLGLPTNDTQLMHLTALMTTLRMMGVNKYFLYLTLSFVAQYLRTHNIRIPKLMRYLNIMLLGSMYAYRLLGSDEFLSLTVREVRQISIDTFVIVCKKSIRFPLLKCGQHIVVEHNGLLRAYTPIHDTTDEIVLMIKRYEEGQMSTYLTNLGANQIINVNSIKGSDLYENGKFYNNNIQMVPQHVNIICAGTGITPFIRMLAESSFPNATILHTVRSENDSVYLNLINTSKYKSHTHLTSQSGRINKQTIIRTCMFEPSSLFLVCGTKLFNENIKEMLVELDIEVENIICYE